MWLAINVLKQLIAGMILLFVAVLVAWLLTQPFYWWRRGAPSLLPLPLIGSFFPAIYLTSKQFLEHLYYSIPDAPYIGVHLLTRPTLYLKDPKVIQEILEEKSSFFNSHGIYSHRKLDPIARSLFHLECDEWKNVRMKLSPHFSPSKIKTIMQVCKSSIERLINEINQWLKKDDTADMYRASFFLAADLSSGAFFGIESDVFSKGEESDFYYSAANLNTPASMVKVFLSIVSPWLVDHLNVIAFTKRANDFMIWMVDSCVKNRLKNPGPVRNIVDGLADMMAKNPEEFDVDLVRSQGVLMWTGGVETTATALAFALYELAEDRELQSELRRKLKAGEGQALVRAVVTETLRKYPLFSILSRKCTERCKLSTGLVVDPGTLIVIPALTVHRDPKNYPDPDKFILDRPLPKGAYLAFGAGPRTCLGMRMGLSVLEEALMNLVEKYEFFPAKEPMVLKPRTFFTAPGSGLKLRVRKIKTEENTIEN